MEGLYLFVAGAWRVKVCADGRQRVFTLTLGTYGVNEPCTTLGIRLELYGD
jgi:hypothetical protein